LLELSAPITSLIELRICSACPSSVGLPLPSAKPLVGEAAMGADCGGAGWFPLPAAVRARAEPALADPAEAPAELAPAEPARDAATPAAAPSKPAAPAVSAVTAVLTIATAVLPMSPLTMRLAMKGMTAIARE
jgi:hypothetical protein